MNELFMPVGKPAGKPCYYSNLDLVHVYTYIVNCCIADGIRHKPARELENPPGNALHRADY